MTSLPQWPCDVSGGTGTHGTPNAKRPQMVEKEFFRNMDHPTEHHKFHLFGRLNHLSDGKKTKDLVTTFL